MALFQNPEWTAYDAAMVTYRANLRAWEASNGTNQQNQDTLRAKLLELRARAESLTAQIGTKAEWVWENETLNAEYIAYWLYGGAGAIGTAFGALDADPVKDTRFYVTTFVTDWGEESAPSPVSDMTEPTQYDAVRLQLPLPPPARNITKIRIYRSNAGSSGAAFQFVAEVPAGTASYDDAKVGAQLGEVLPTTTWLEPPAQLRGLVGLPNGVMAGFLDNTLAFCEPYAPYAWPLEYQITVEYPIVALGVFGQTMFVGTTGSPYFVSGSDAASMSALKMDSNQACVAARSVVAVRGGVLYASPDGLCLASTQGVQVVTAGVFTREEWQKLTPASIVAAESESVYYLSYDGNGGGTYAFDLELRKLIRVNLPMQAVFVDRLNDALYTAAAGKIVRATGSGSTRTALWKSGRAAIPMHAGLAWVQVEGFQTPDKPAVLRIFGDNYRIGRRGEVFEYVGSQLRRRSDGHLFEFLPDGKIRNATTAEVLAVGTEPWHDINCTALITSAQPARLPAGRWRDHEIEVESKARITRVTLAGNTDDLKNV